MTQLQLRSAMYELVTMYFDNTRIDVTWGMTKQVSAGATAVVLTMGSLNRSQYPVTCEVNGVSVSSYYTLTTMQVDLYTRGRQIRTNEMLTASYENTALDDMAGFLNFLSSDYISEWTAERDITILCNSVNDLSEIINDTSWRYRSMAEIEIRFTQHAVGYAGNMYANGIPYYENGNPKYDSQMNPIDENGNPYIPDEPVFEQSPSSGGTAELADIPTYWFEQVRVNEHKEESHEDG